MPDFVINDIPVQELTARMRTAGQAHERDRVEALEFLGTKFVGFMRSKVQEVRYTGALEKSIRWDREGSRLVKIYPNPGASGMSAEKVRNIWKGGPPRYIPVSLLKPWARQKLGDENAAYPVQKSILVRGTSSWQAARRGTMGFPFPEETLAAPESIRTMRMAARRLGEKLIGHIAGSGMEPLRV